MKINQRLDIILSAANTTEYYHSRIEEINEQYLMLAMPMRQQIPVIPLAGTMFYGSVTNETGRYQFTSIYKDKKANPIPVWIATLPTDIKKIQLRSFVRLDFGIKVLNKWFSEDGEETEQAVTRDLSGGGLCLISKWPLKGGTEVVLTLDLEEQGIVSATGIVIRSQPQKSDKPLFLLGVEFADIIERDRSKIIKFIYQKQLERKRKGL